MSDIALFRSENDSMGIPNNYFPDALRVRRHHHRRVRLAGPVLHQNDPETEG